MHGRRVFDVQSKPGIEAVKLIKMDTLICGVSYERTEVHEFGIGPPASPERLAMAGRECGMKGAGGY